jgi:predicted phosphodiesterase
VRLAVLSDVHGNRIALEAVVADGRDQGVDGWWALGDLVAVGPDPVDTLELLANLDDLVATRGNTDRYTLTGDRPPPHPEDVIADPGLLGLFTAVESSFSWTRGALASHGWLPWLEELPLDTREELADGTRLLGVHASPGRDDGPGITPHRPAGELQADLAGAGADIVVAGHTHQPTDRRVGGVRAVNAGSVSNPITDDLRAGYVIVHADRHGHRVEHRRVAYDRDAFLRRVGESGHPQHDFIASFQRGEQVRHPSQRAGAPVTAGPPPGDRLGRQASSGPSRSSSR